MLEDKVLNISAYAPQVTCEESQVKQLSQEMDEIMPWGIPVILRIGTYTYCVW